MIASASDLPINKTGIVETAFAFGPAVLTGVIKSTPEDFFVDELLGFTPSGEGEHVFLYIEKRAVTTHQLRDSIADIAQCQTMDVGYSGLKDKWAVTRQWFSVYLPGRAELDWSSLQSVGSSENELARVTILDCQRHHKKLRRGVHRSNAFRLSVRNLLSDSSKAPNAEAVNERLRQIGEFGFPNFFAEQRFGFEGRNLDKARRMFASKRRVSRDQRSIYLSAVRAYLFNQFLSQRLMQSNWAEYELGDVLMLNGTRSQFTGPAALVKNGELEPLDNAMLIELESLAQRLREGDIHISGPLFGVQASVAVSASLLLETQIANGEPSLIAGLQANKLESARRSLRVMPEQLEWDLDSEKLQLSFVLPTGSYATALLRELVAYPA